MLTNAYTIEFLKDTYQYTVAIINHYKGSSFGNSVEIIPTFLKVEITFPQSNDSSKYEGFSLFFDGGEFVYDLKDELGFFLYIYNFKYTIKK